MIKRIFSKKSGFTLVEILVAFAIFAIMASAIMQIMIFVSREKSDNAKFMETLEAQEELLAANGKEKYKEEEGKIVLNFKDKTPTEIIYDMKAANGAEDGVGDGLAYYVTKESTDGSVIGGGGSPGTSGGDAGEQGQMSAVDARITGSTKFDVIRIEEIKKAGDEYKGEGVCYYMQLYAGANSLMTEDEQKYAQFKLNFFNSVSHDTTKQYTDADKKTYTREVYDAANIVDAGYVNCSSLDAVDWSNCKSVVKEKNIASGDSTNNPYYVSKTSDNTLRISSPYVNAGKTEKFDRRSFRIYVVFAEDPGLTLASFGRNGTSNGTFNACPIWKETYNLDGTCKYEPTGEKSNYIYGAYMYKRNYL